MVADELDEDPYVGHEEGEGGEPDGRERVLALELQIVGVAEPHGLCHRAFSDSGAYRQGS